MSSAGKWLGEVGGIWQEDGKTYLSAQFLEREPYASAASWSLWFHWVKSRCLDLDPNVNGGRIRSLLRPGRMGQKTRVFLQADVDQIVERRADPANRKGDPAGLGYWVTDNEVYKLLRNVPSFGLVAGDLCFAAPKAAVESGFGTDSLIRMRTHPHPAFDQQINGGCIRCFKIHPQNRAASGGAVPVYPEQDTKLLATWRQEQQEKTADLTDSADPTEAAGPADPTLSWKTDTEIADAISWSIANWENRIKLSRVLKQFREAVPDAAQQSPRWDKDRKQRRLRWRLR